MTWLEGKYLFLKSQTYSAPSIVKTHKKNSPFRCHLPSRVTEKKYCVKEMFHPFNTVSKKCFILSKSWNYLHGRKTLSSFSVKLVNITCQLTPSYKIYIAMQEYCSPNISDPNPLNPERAANGWRLVTLLFDLRPL